MSSHASRSSPGFFLLLICIVLSVGTSCTALKGNDVDTTLTEETARAELIDYFRNTLEKLPMGVSLALEPAAPGDTAAYNAGTVAPCDDNDQSGSGLVNLGLIYWVHGVKTTENSDYFHKIVQIWRDWNWSIDEDATSGFLRGRASGPDDYTVTVVDNSRGGLAIMGSSPCFPRTATGTPTPQPTTVDHP